MPIPGETFGHFAIQRLLGSGGMGQVFEAIDTRLDRVVALKLINADLAGSADYRARLATEARMAAKVDSPYVVKIWEHSVIDDQPYIAMEFVAGEDLRESTAGYNLQQKLDVVYQVAEGIGAAHAAGLLHRDLKPENIRLTSAGKVKIFDFGLAKTVQADTVDEAGNIEGTLSYLSPEQLAGEPLTLSSDLFSFGVILYELFTGTRPFDSEHSAGIVYAILHEDPTPPCEVNHELPDWIDPLVMKLLGKVPADRFADVAEIVNFIHAAQLGMAGAGEAGYVEPSKKVTVIDLKNLSGDPNWDYFCMGFTEDVIREISRRTNLVVSAEPATSVSRDVRELFAHFRSDFVIVGSLLKHMNAVRLQLSVYGENGSRTVWGETFQGDASELFTILSKAAEGASVALADATGVQVLAAPAPKPADVSAYDFYLKGKNYYQTNKSEDLVFAARMYQRAIEIDPGFALAHAGLSDVYTFQYMAYYDRTPERIAAAKSEAEKALALDAGLPEGHRSLGRYYMFTGDLANAEACFHKSISCDPKYAVGYRTLGWLKRGMGAYEEANTWARKALDLAPTDLETLLLLSLISMDQRKFTLAVATLQRAIELGPDYGRAYYNLGLVYSKLGAVDQALQNYELAIKYKGDPNCYIDAGYIYLLKRDFKKAERRFEESIEADYLAFVALYYLGYMESLKGVPEAARAHLDRALELIDGVLSKGSTDSHIKSYKALALAASGRRDEAVGVLEGFRDNDLSNGEVVWNLARSWALMGIADKSAGFIEKALTAHAGPTEFEIEQDPHLTGVRSRAPEPSGA